MDIEWIPSIKIIEEERERQRKLQIEAEKANWKIFEIVKDRDPKFLLSFSCHIKGISHLWDYLELPYDYQIDFALGKKDDKVIVCSNEVAMALIHDGFIFKYFH